MFCWGAAVAVAGVEVEAVESDLIGVYTYYNKQLNDVFCTLSILSRLLSSVISSTDSTDTDSPPSALIRMQFIKSIGLLGDRQCPFPFRQVSGLADVDLDALICLTVARCGRV